MKKSNIFKLAALGLALSTTSVFAQDTNTDKHTIDIKIPEVALLDLETSGSSSALSLAGTAPTEAGNAIDFSKAQNSDLWINYSSIIGSKTEPSREVTVAITSGSVPDGLNLTVEAKADANKGAGKVGTPSASALTLSGTAQKIVTGVGSAYTGNGANAGHNLIYKLALDSGSYEKLDFDQSQSVTVTYTLTDN